MEGGHTGGGHSLPLVGGSLVCRSSAVLGGSCLSVGARCPRALVVRGWGVVGVVHAWASSSCVGIVVRSWASSSVHGASSCMGGRRAWGARCRPCALVGGRCLWAFVIRPWVGGPSLSVGARCPWALVVRGWWRKVVVVWLWGSVRCRKSRRRRGIPGWACHVSDLVVAPFVGRHRRFLVGVGV